MSQGRKFLKVLERRGVIAVPPPSVPAVRRRQRNDDLLAMFSPSEADVLSPDFLNEIQNNQQPPDQPLAEQQAEASPALSIPPSPDGTETDNFEISSPDPNKICISAKAVQEVKVCLFKEQAATSSVPRIGHNVEELSGERESEVSIFNQITPLVNVSQFVTVTPAEGAQHSPELTPLENVSFIPPLDINSVEFEPSSAESNINDNIVRPGLKVRKALFLASPSKGLLSTASSDGPIEPTALSEFPSNNQCEQESIYSSLTFDAQAEPLQEPSYEEVISDSVPDHTEEVFEPVQSKKRKRPSVVSVETPPKKRCVQRLNWKSVKAKTAYNAGIAHTSLRGKEIKARELKPSCPATCRKQCTLKISHPHRMSLFDKYYGLQNKCLQWNMINKLVKTNPIAQRTTTNEDKEKPYRNHSYAYFLHDPNGNSIQVCQTMFVNTFDISMSVVHTALSKNSPDKRGKNSNNKKRLSPDLVQNVKDHIKQFPMVESHYCRENTRKKYLDENLSIAKMHRLYTMERGEVPHTANMRQYRDIFNTCFNLSFFKPKKDQCAECVRWEQFTTEEKEKFSQKHQEHITNKNTVRELKKTDKKYSKEAPEKNVRVLTFDLQKVFYCPKSEVGEFFYKRKLTSYNFTIFDCTTGQAYCYVWDQTTAARGADEIASCVLLYFEEAVKNGVNEFRIYSDSCSGQNKNQFLFTMYYLAARKYNVKVVHRYLEKGHTQMECDSVHALIERKTRHIDIYTPAVWYGHIKTCKVQKPAYVVKELDQTIIFTFKDIAAQHFIWKKIPVSKIKEITIDSTYPDVATYRLHFDDVCKSAKILQQKRGRPINWTTIQLHPAYSAPLPLKPKLIQDLKWYLQKELIPSAFKSFYIRLTEQQTSHAVDDDEDDDTPQEVIDHQPLHEENEDEEGEENEDQE